MQKSRRPKDLSIAETEKRNPPDGWAERQGTGGVQNCGRMEVPLPAKCFFIPALSN